MAHALVVLTLATVLGAFVHPAWGQSRDARDWSREAARAAPDWVRDAIVYEVAPRAFSPEGNLAGVTARLDHVRDVGATVVWLMPIHPIGQALDQLQGPAFSQAHPFFGAVQEGFGRLQVFGGNLHQVLTGQHPVKEFPAPGANVDLFLG